MSPRASYVLSGIAAAVAAALAVVLYVQITTLAAERDGAVRGLADERSRAGHLRADLDKLKQDNDLLMNGQKMLARSKEAVEQDRDGWKSRAEKAGRELETAQAKLGETETALKQTRETLEAAEKEKGSLRDRAEKAGQETSDAKGLLQAEVQAHEKTRGALAERDHELAVARTEITGRDEEIRKLQGRLAEPAR